MYIIWTDTRSIKTVGHMATVQNLECVSCSRIHIYYLDTHVCRLGGARRDALSPVTMAIRVDIYGGRRDACSFSPPASRPNQFCYYDCAWSHQLLLKDQGK
ncbi:hypothetical protein NQ317_003142 [Molorchus minor]|uniref:Uncharacterized protein n=1 Tax=Molorchus minor TaxID=1323400 RepID=A0ABQ9JZP3_9CUCU|nr:hypothetical protein NQ317_003142 [Molorchus minor]